MVDYSEPVGNRAKVQEFRNLAEFAQTTVEEIELLNFSSPNEYAQLLERYRSYCLKQFNEKCFKFNEQARQKMPTSHLNNDDGLTA